jgi:hypothetical protein
MAQGGEELEAVAVAVELDQIFAEIARGPAADGRVASGSKTAERALV